MVPRLLILGAMLLLVPGVAQANMTTPRTLAQMLEESAAVVRMTITRIDENAYNAQEEEPYTLVAGDVVEVLAGDIGKHHAFLVRGGLRPNGDRRHYIDLNLQVGETYLLFLRAQYQISPILAAYREAVVDGVTVLVGEEGHLLDWSGEYPQLAEAVVDIEQAGGLGANKSRASNDQQRIVTSKRMPLMPLPRRFQSALVVSAKIRQSRRIAAPMGKTASRKPASRPSGNLLVVEPAP